MLASMRRILLVLLSLLCMLSAQRLTSGWKSNGAASTTGVTNPIEVFARLLVLSSISAFDYSVPGGSLRLGKPTLASHRPEVSGRRHSLVKMEPLGDEWVWEPIHSWFDPLQRWGYDVAERPSQQPLLAYVPGLDGSNGSPFIQFPTLAKQFELVAQDVSFESSANAASFQNIVDDVAAYLRKSGNEKRFILGESYGGLIAAGVALCYPDLLSGLIIVNPATAVSKLPELQEDIEWVRFGNIPDPLVPFAILGKVGWKTFDSDMMGNAVRDIFIEKKLEKLRTIAPDLAAYYDAALVDFTGQLGALKPADFWRGRLAQLCEGIKFVEPRLPSLTLPVLIVAGTADKLLTSDKEAERLASILPDSDVHLVPGAGHAGTLDQRVDLPAVISQWAAKRGLAIEPAALESVEV